jgi:hypothetical protein
MKGLQLHALVCLLACGIACAGPRVRVPPRVDLSAYPTVGVLVFSSNATGNLEEYTTQRFMQDVQAAQRGVHFLELGSEAEVLRALGRTRLDFEAARALGQKWGVAAVFSGELDVTQVKPRVQLERLVQSMSLQADVEATLHARLVETGAGTTVWTRTSAGSAPVASVRIGSRGPIDFGARDPEQAYGSLVHALVGALADDFYSHWERQ